MSLKAIYYDRPQDCKESYSGEALACCNTKLLSSSRNLITVRNPIITLEPDNWRLNGRYNTVPTYAPPSFWGTELSDGDGELANPPVVCLQLSRLCTATAVSLIFWEESSQWCSRATLYWYRGDTLLEQKTVYPDSPRLTVQQLVRDFDRLELRLEKTSQPYRFPRLNFLRVGQETVFTGDTLTAVTLVTEYDPTGCELHADTMTLQVQDEAHVIAPQEGQALELYRDDRLIASQRLVSSRRTGEHSHVLTAQSMVGHLEEKYMGGIFEFEPADYVLYSILGNSNDYEMDDSLRLQQISGYLPVCTRREALQQLAFVLGARVDTLDGKVHLRAAQQTVTGEFTPAEVFTGARMETENALVRLELTAHSYAMTVDEQLLLENVYVDGENVLLLLPSPAQVYRVEGGTVTESGVNYVRVTAQGPVTVYGAPYIHTAVIHSRSLPGSGTVLSVDRVTLLDASRVEAVMDRIMAASAHRQKLTQDVVLTDQFAGQLVTTPTPWGSMLNGYITAVESHLTPGGQTATVTLLGTETI